MKLYLENDNGSRTTLDKLNSVGDGDIVLHSAVRMHDKEIEKLEKEFSKKFQRKVILLDARYDGILTIPPIAEDTFKPLGTGEGD